MKNSFNKFVFTVVLISFQFTYQANATDRYVDNAANGANNGASWTDAWQSFADIQWNSIQAGDIIYISGGSTEKTYYEALSIGASGNQGNPITIKVGQDSGHDGEVIISNKNLVEDQGIGIRIILDTYILIDGNVGGDTSLSTITNFKVM